jgi:hypothetical protein
VIVTVNSLTRQFRHGRLHRRPAGGPGRQRLILSIADADHRRRDHTRKVTLDGGAGD